MEAAPRLPMISFELKVSTEPVSFGTKLKQYIAAFYHEDPESYNNEIHNLESLRAMAVRPAIDVTGCQTLKKYYCQLNFLKSRFPMEKGQAAAISFSWKDLYAGLVCTVSDIDFELSSILYNIGVLHTELGASDTRSTSEGMKMACTHFQCAAWAFQHLKENYSQLVSLSLAAEVIHFMYQLCLAQAQECILEKSMMDNRKATIIAKVAVQVVDYYNQAIATLMAGSEEGSMGEIVGSRVFKDWSRYLKFKLAYNSCIALLYQGQQAEEAQKMGERVAYYQAASEQLEEARKVAKNSMGRQQHDIEDALGFTQDVVEGKKKAAKNENEFIYHEVVPERDALTQVNGASLVKGIPFSVNDIEVSGPDIFQRLVPMEAHEASSIYSEQKAEMLRQIGAIVDNRDAELAEFMSSLQLECVSEWRAAGGVPQGLVDRAADICAKPAHTHALVEAMARLANTYHDVEALLAEIQEMIKEEERKEQEYQKVMGVRPPGIVATDLSREAGKYTEAHSKANESNQTLHRAMTMHISNLKILAQPLGELKKAIPSSTSGDPAVDESIIAELETLVAKVDEMRIQRATLVAQLREAVCSDDITGLLVTKPPEMTLDQLFQQELAKHKRQAALIEQNLSAQDNILKALTEAYAKFAPTRRYIVDLVKKREATTSALIASYDAYDDLLAKANKGIEFYQKLEGNVNKLLQRIKSTCRVQEEEREQMLAKATPVTTNTKPSTGPKLKDYLDRMKGGPLPQENPWIPAVRPTPLGEENSNLNAQSDKPNLPPSYDMPGYYPAYPGTYQTGTDGTYPSQPPPYSQTPANYYPTSNTSNVTTNPSANPVPNPSYDYQNYYNYNMPNSANANSAGYQAPTTYSLPTYTESNAQPSYQPAAYVSNYPNSTPSPQQTYQQDNSGYSTGYSASNTNLHPATDKPATNMTATNPAGYSGYSTSEKSGYNPAYSATAANPANPAGYNSGYATGSTVSNNPAGSSGYSTVPNNPSSNPAGYNTGYSTGNSVSTNPTPAGYSTGYSSNNAGQTGSTVPTGYAGYYTSTNPDSKGYNTGYSVGSNISTDSRGYNSGYSDSTVPVTNTPGYNSGYPTNNTNLSTDYNTTYSGNYNMPACSTGNISNSTGYTGYTNYATNSTAGNISNQTYPSQYSQGYQSSATPANNTGNAGNATGYNTGYATYPGYAPQTSNTYQTPSGYYQPSASTGYNTTYQTPSVNYPTNSNPQPANITINTAGPNNQIPNNQVANNQVPSNQTPNSQVSNNQVYDNQASSNQVYNNQVPNNQVPNNQVPNNQVPNNQVPNNQPSSNQVPSNETPSNQISNIQMYNNQTANNQLPSNQVGISQVSNNQPNNVANNPDTINYQQYPQYYVGYQPSISTTESNDPARNLQYTNAGTYHTNQTDSGTVLPTSQPNTNTNLGNYYSSPYGYQTVGSTSSMTMMHANNNALSSSKSTTSVDSKTNSNVDLLAGLDFSVGQAPLEPQVNATGTQPVNEPIKETRTEPKLEPSTPQIPQEEVVIPKLEDPFNEPEVLNQFIQKVEEFEKFVDGLTTKTLNGPTPLDLKWKEIQDIQEKDSQKSSISVARCYPMKNRFPDILPYDHSRVELPSTKDDYINASHIRQLSLNSPPFIVTQSPLASTLADFWSMVWEQQIEVIVCLLADSEMEGCIYWPKEKGQELSIGGRFRIILQSVNLHEHWIERIISITDSENGTNNSGRLASHVIVHLQFTVWPRAGMFPNSGPVIALAAATLAYHRQQRVRSRPVLVHCLSGVGPSGVLCLLTAAISDPTATLDVPAVAAKMCRQRKNIIRDREHLKFAYQAVLHHAQDILTKRGVLTAKQLQMRFQNVAIESTVTDDSSRRSSVASDTSVTDQSKQRRRFTPESFTALKEQGIASAQNTSDPLSALDPLWTIKKE